MAQLNEVDLPPKLLCLKDIDTLLRCPICFEFLNISMMTQCSHNFCSLCIRKFLSYKLLCPVCNSASTEQDLRNNRLLDDLVECFQTASQKLHQINLESPPFSPQTVANVFNGKLVTKKSLKKESSTLSHYFQKKNPATLPSKTLNLQVKSEPVELRVQQTDIKQESKDVETMDVFPSTSQSSKLLVKVECPVCEVGVPEQHINKHLDMCLNRESKKEVLRSAGRRKGIPKLLYSLITTPKLKKMLKESHLSAQGSRDQLVRRHQEFTLMYNAQCDALNPKSAEEIAKEVENNERLKNQLDNKRKPIMVTTKNQTAEEIEEVHSAYRKQHSSEFSRLIAQVRGRLDTSKRAQAKQEEGEQKEEADSKAGGHSRVQSTLGSTALTVKSVEMDSVIERPSGSSSPANSDVSLHFRNLQLNPKAAATPMHGACVPLKFGAADYSEKSPLQPCDTCLDYVTGALASSPDGKRSESLDEGVCRVKRRREEHSVSPAYTSSSLVDP
ncbi:hypothetical protein DNTS_014838, partial [Danionella cerebrum]